jgi:hypothetical protein
MRHAAKPVSVTTIASWLVVTVVGVSIGAIGAGGLMDLVNGDRSVDLPATSTAADLHPTGDGAQSGSGAALSGGRVVAPSAVPDGAALGGRAPSARGAASGDYSPFKPTTIRLPSGRLAPVQPAGVHSDGVLNVPQDPERVGWWTGGAQAGEPFGSIVLAGHVDSRQYGMGAMAEMLRMKPGEIVKLGNGRHGQRYKVASVRNISKASLAEGTDLFDQDVPHRLVMITCGGPFDLRTHRYRDNVVVIADPVL